jgi:hypothetical protein
MVSLAGGGPRLSLGSSFRRKPESSVFASILSKCGSTRPAAERVTFWQLPQKVTKKV